MKISEPLTKSSVKNWIWLIEHDGSNPIINYLFIIKTEKNIT